MRLACYRHGEYRYCLKHGGNSIIAEPFSFDLEVDRVMESFRTESAQSHQQMWKINYAGDIDMKLLIVSIKSIIRVMVYVLYCSLILTVSAMLSFLLIMPLPTITVNTFVDGFHLGSLRINDANGGIIVVPKVSQQKGSVSHHGLAPHCVERVRNLLQVECIATLKFNLQWISPFAEVAVEHITIKESTPLRLLLTIIVFLFVNAAFTILTSAFSPDIRTEEAVMFSDIVSCLLHDVGLLRSYEHDCCVISYRAIDSVSVKSIGLGHVPTAFYVFALDGSEFLESMMSCTGQRAVGKSMSRWKIGHVQYSSVDFEAIVSNFSCTFDDDSASGYLHFDWDRLEIVRVDNGDVPSNALLSIDTFDDERIRTISVWDDASSEIRSLKKVLRPILSLRNVHGSSLYHCRPTIEASSASQLVINSLQLRSSSEVTLHSPSLYRIIPHPVFVHMAINFLN